MPVTAINFVQPAWGALHGDRTPPGWGLNSCPGVPGIDHRCKRSRGFCGVVDVVQPLPVGGEGEPEQGAGSGVFRWRQGSTGDLAAVRCGLAGEAVAGVDGEQVPVGCDGQAQGTFQRPVGGDAGGPDNEGGGIGVFSEPGPDGDRPGRDRRRRVDRPTMRAAGSVCSANPDPMGPAGTRPAGRGPGPDRRPASWWAGSGPWCRG